MDTSTRIALEAFLRPFILVLLIAFIGRPLAKLLWHIWPEGVVKRFVYRPVPREGEWTAFGLLLLTLVVCSTVAYWLVTTFTP